MSDVSKSDASVPSADELVAAFWAVPRGLYVTQVLLVRIEDRLHRRGHRSVVIDRVDDLRRLPPAAAQDALAILREPDLQLPIDPSAAASLLRTGS